MSDTQSLDQFIERQLQSGKYPSYEAMVQEGLRLLQAYEVRKAEAKRLADELRPAIEEWRSGHSGIALDAADVIRRGRERNVAKHGHHLPRAAM